MITNEQIKALQQRVETLGRCINIEEKRAEVQQKQEKTLAAEFWNDPKEAEKFLKELAGVKFWVSGYDKVAAGTADLDVLYDFAKESVSDSAEDIQRTYCLYPLRYPVQCGRDVILPSVVPMKDRYRFPRARFQSDRIVRISFLVC